MTYLVTALEECNRQYLHVVAAVVRLAVVSQNKEGKQVLAMAGKDTLVPRRDMEYTGDAEAFGAFSRGYGVPVTYDSGGALGSGAGGQEGPIAGLLGG